MCNYCITTYNVSSRSKAYIAHLHANLKEVFASKANNLKHFANRYGYFDSHNNQFYNAGDYFDFCDEGISYRDGVFSCQFSVISRWTPMPDLFFSIAHNQYKDNVTVTFQAEEPGFQLFTTYDDTGVWFRSKYRLSYYADGDCKDYYFEMYADVIDHIQKVFPKARASLYDSIPEVEKLVNNSYDSTDDFFFSLNAFVRYDSPINYKERSVA